MWQRRAMQATWMRTTHDVKVLDVAATTHESHEGRDVVDEPQAALSPEDLREQCEGDQDDHEL